MKQIKAVWFTYNGQDEMPTDKRFVGIIAQDMQKIAPHMMGTFIYQDSLGNKTEYLDYDANALTYMLVNSVKEQQKIIEQKDEKIEQMATEIEELDKRLSQLERIVTSNMTHPLTNSVARTNEINENGVILDKIRQTSSQVIPLSAFLFRKRSSMLYFISIQTTAEKSVPKLLANVVMAQLPFPPPTLTMVFSFMT